MSAEDTEVRASRGAVALRGAAVAAGWAIAVGGVALSATELTGWFATVTAVVVAQAAALYLLGSAVPVVLMAVVTRRRRLAAVAAIPTSCLLVLAVPLIRYPEPPTVDADAPVVTVLHANVHYLNRTPAQTADALLDADADVLAMSEFTHPVADALDALGAAQEYPYRIDGATDGPTGIALWSRRPIVDGEIVDIGGMPGIVARLAVDDRTMRIVVAHPAPPLADSTKGRWVPALRQVNALARENDLPTLVVADLNASWWHPAYRRVASDGLVDVHRVLGHGFSVSWPTNRWPPTFVRIDHALTHGALEPRRIVDVPVPSTDHEAFVVEVAVGIP